MSRTKLAAVALCLMIGQQSANGDGETAVSFKVPATQGWVKASAMEVKKGKKYKIGTDGTWSADPTYTYKYPKFRISGPWYDQRSRTELITARTMTGGVGYGVKKSRTIELPGEPYGGLIYRIGDGPAQFIGAGGTIKADRSGPIYFSINDRHDAECLADNIGEITVTIRRR